MAEGLRGGPCIKVADFMYSCMDAESTVAKTGLLVLKMTNLMNTSCIVSFYNKMGRLEDA